VSKPIQPKGPTVLSQKLYSVIAEHTSGGKFWTDKSRITSREETYNLLLKGGHIQETTKNGTVYVGLTIRDEVTFNQMDELGDLGDLSFE
jgi:hypothetical protein